MIHVSDPSATGIFENTDYWIRWRLFDDTATLQNEIVCGPNHTQAYPATTCLTSNITQTSAKFQVGTSGGNVNINAPCNQDTVTWEYGTSAGGPYPTTIGPDPATPSPSTTVTGLTPGTTYHYRAHLTEQAHTAAEYRVSAECTFTTAAATITPAATCAAATGVTQTAASISGTADGALTTGTVQLCYGTTAGGPYGTCAAVAAGTNAVGQPAGPAALAGLTAATAYFYRTEIRDSAAAMVAASTECTFTTSAVVTPPVSPFSPQPCAATGDAAIPCGEPQQFCFSSTATVDQPGRQYDLNLTIGRGFNVTGILKDLSEAPTNIVWAVTDDGTQFASDLQAAVGSQFPGATTTVTAGAIDQCTGVGTFAIHIECLRLDQAPPTLVQIKYNAGRDLIQNPAFTTAPPSPSGGFPKRADNVSNPIGSTTNVDCTAVANRGWETNDNAEAFELWGNPTTPGNTANSTGTTPTPRGTAVQEINAYGSGPASVSLGFPYGQNPDTIWQTFVVPAAGNFTIKVVVGGRGQTNLIPVKLSTGDVNDTGIGDVINTVVTAPSVNNEAPNSSAGPWTTFTQTVPLAPGTYTLAFTGPNAPFGGGDANSFGGLFTDMRVFSDAPSTVSNFANDDNTCTVPVTTNSQVCAFWAPTCTGGMITGWTRVSDGTVLSNAAFWAQVPAPACCTSSPGSSGTPAGSNLMHSDLVCGVTDTGTRTMIRTVVADPSGSPISETFTDTTGALASPSSWQPGQCAQASAARDTEEEVLCDVAGGISTPFVRRTVFSAADGAVVSSTNLTLAGAPFTPAGVVGVCAGSAGFEDVLVCGVVAAVPTPLFRREVKAADGSSTVTFLTASGATVVPTSWTPGGCPSTGRDVEELVLCDTAGSGTVTAFVRRRVFSAADGSLVSSTDLTLAGAAYVPTGTVGACRDVCTTQSSIGTICYTPPVAPARLSDDWTGAPSAVGGGGRTWTNSAFAGAGITVTEATVPDGGATLLANGVRNTAVNPATQAVTLDLGAPRTNVVLRWDFFGTGQGERLRSISPAPTSISGNGTLVLGNTGVDGGPAGDGTMFLTFPGPVQTITWSYAPTGAGLSGQSAIAFDSPTAATVATAAVLRDCSSGAVTLVDLATGTVLTPASITVVDCDTVVSYASAVRDVTGGVPYTFVPAGTLVSWNARNRNATTATVRVNGGPVLPMDSGETIGTDLAGDDVNDVLADTVVVDPGDGAVRVIEVRRL